MSVSDKLLLRRRAVIETVNDKLKNIAQVEHSKHRSFGNFVVNLLGGIAAYCYFPKKPSIRVQTVDISNDRQLIYPKVYSSNSRYNIKKRHLFCR